MTGQRKTEGHDTGAGVGMAQVEAVQRPKWERTRRVSTSSRGKGE